MKKFFEDGNHINNPWETLLKLWDKLKTYVTDLLDFDKDFLKRVESNLVLLLY